MRVLRILPYFFKKRPWSVIGLLAAILIASLAEGVGIGFLLPLLEAISTQEDMESASRVSRVLSEVFATLGIPFVLWTIMLGGFAFFLMQAILKYLEETRSVKLASYITADVRAQTFESLLHADLTYIHNKSGGDLTNSLITEPMRLHGAFSFSTRLVAMVIESAVYFGLALYLSWQLVLAAFVLMGGILLLVTIEFKKAGRYGEHLTQINKSLQITAMEQLSGLRILRAFGLESLSLGTFKHFAYDSASVSYAVTKSRSRLTGIFRIGTLGALLAIVYVAVTWLDLNMAILLTFVFILYRLYPRVGGINGAYHQLLTAIPGVENITTLLKETENPTIRSGAAPFTKLEDEITFDGVGFSYDGQVPVLTDLKFSVVRGETTAIVGGSGAGKTTVVNLIMRFYDPISGRVLVDGMDLKEMDLSAWRRAISLVNQDIFLFNDTIYNNIAMGRQGATRDEIVDAARLAYADEFIKELPGQYDTTIGDRGVRLSGGQRQRIALARAVLRDPQVLILDEATSELDTKSEQLIRRAVEELGASRTVITIAHRLSTIRHADKIVVFEGGRVVEQGSHEVLLEGNGPYSEFLRVQELVAGKAE